jgi:hypothetical protein
MESMDYLHHELNLQAGDIVEVTLDHAANVLLLDPSNYSAYQQRCAFRYWGGHATQSPFRIAAPHAGRWHLVIDLGGAAGTVRASVRVLSGATIP